MKSHTTSKAKKKWSFKLLQTQDRMRQDGSFPIALVLCFCQQRSITTLDLMALPEQWDKEFERYSLKGANRHPDALKYNVYLNSLSTTLDETISDLTKRKIPFTNTMIIEHLFIVEKTTRLKTYILQLIEQLEKQECFGHALTFVELSEYLEKFDKSLDKRLFAGVNYNYVVKFVQYQLKNGRKKGGIPVNVRSLRTVLNTAIQDNAGSPETVVEFIIKLNEWNQQNQRIYLIRKHLYRYIINDSVYSITYLTSGRAYPFYDILHNMD